MSLTFQHILANPTAQNIDQQNSESNVVRQKILSLHPQEVKCKHVYELPHWQLYNRYSSILHLNQVIENDFRGPRSSLPQERFAVEG